MLIDAINESTLLGEKYKKSSVSEKHLKEVEHIRTEIFEMLPTITKILVASKDVKSISQVPILEIDRLRRQLLSLKDEIGDLDREQVISKLEGIVFLRDQSKAKLEQEWSNYRSENYTKNANMIHSLLAVIDNDSRLDELGLLGNDITSKKIGDAETISKVKKYQEISHKIIKDLKMSPDVEDFVMKLSHGEELVLEEVSEEIMKWLISHKVSKKIKLTI